MATNTTPSEMKGMGVDAGGTPLPVARPPKPAAVPGYKIVWDEKTRQWTYVSMIGADTKDDKTDGSGGGTKKAPPDPYAPIVRSFFSAYFKIWGTLPPPGYVEKAARKMNLYEFMEQERKKPAFRKTKMYRDEAAKFAAMRDQLLGYY